MNKGGIKNKWGYVYTFFYEEADGYRVKIGITAANVRDRQRNVSSKHPCYIAVWGYVNRYFELEQSLHKQYKDKRILGEWFDLTPQDMLDLRDIIIKRVIKDHNKSKPPVQAKYGVFHDEITFAEMSCRYHQDLQELKKNRKKLIKARETIMEVADKVSRKNGGKL